MVSVRIDLNELEVGHSLNGEWEPVDWHTLTINKDSEAITIVPYDGDVIVLPYTSSALTLEVP